MTADWDEALARLLFGCAGSVGVRKLKLLFPGVPGLIGGDVWEMGGVPKATFH